MLYHVMSCAVMSCQDVMSCHVVSCERVYHIICHIMCHMSIVDTFTVFNRREMEGGIKQQRMYVISCVMSCYVMLCHVIFHVRGCTFTVFNRSEMEGGIQQRDHLGGQPSLRIIELFEKDAALFGVPVGKLGSTGTYGGWGVDKGQLVS